MVHERRPLSTPTYFAFGAASAILGLLPWLITGARLPLQNLWATDSLDMPFALLPFSQYFLSFTAAMLLVGSAIAGIVGRATTAKSRRAALWALIGGVALVQVIALAQTAITVALGIGLDRHRTAAILYLVLITGGIFVSLLVGLGMLALIARAPKAGALVALSIAAVAASSWLSGFLFPINTFATSSPLTNFFSELLRFLPAILIGAAIAWCGVNTRGRIVATVVAVLVLILGPILVTAIFNAAGSRVLAPYPEEMLSYGIGVFTSYLGLVEIWLPLVGLAAAVAFIAIAARRSTNRWLSSAPAHIETPFRPSPATPEPPPSQP